VARLELGFQTTGMNAEVMVRKCEKMSCVSKLRETILAMFVFNAFPSRCSEQNERFIL